MVPPLSIAVIGLGKIARDQHLPAIAADPGFALAATVSRTAADFGVPHFPDLAALLAAGVGVDAVALCMPPGPRPAFAAAARAAGLHILNEKPPAAALAEAQAMVAAPQRTLFTAWHSRFAAGVAPALGWLDGKAIASVHVAWREDVRRWHPGQAWIWAADGFGVLDPGINALSILTLIWPQLGLQHATLDFPANRAAPIAARLALAGCNSDGSEFGVDCDFDWRHAGPDIWRITVKTLSGQTLVLDAGGATLSIDGEAIKLPPMAEYPALYRHFALLCAAGGSDHDLTPLALALGALAAQTNGGRRIVAAFDDAGEGHHHG